MTEPGWYDDPEQGGRGRRYWDGASWTSHYEHPEAPTALAPPNLAGARRAGLPAPAAAPPPQPPQAAAPAYQPEAAAPMSVQQTMINVGSQKSVGTAVLLALFFGPLGMLYSTIAGAIVMFFVNLVVAVFTLGLGLLITFPLGALWAGIAVSNQNGRLGVGMSNFMQPSMPAQAAAPPAQHAPPPPQASLPAAGWKDDPSGSNRLRYWDGSQWTDHFHQLEQESQDKEALPESTSLRDSATTQLSSDVATNATVVETPDAGATEVLEAEVIAPSEEPMDAAAVALVEPMSPKDRPLAESTTNHSGLPASSDVAEATTATHAQVFCENCGQGISDAHQFCPSCGHKQDAEG